MTVLQDTVLFEVSWEVCNKVGGIYTVVSSKASFLHNQYKEYFTIGPLLSSGNSEFEVRPTPASWTGVFEALGKHGIVCKYGVWLIPSEPVAILIDASALLASRNSLKAGFWERFGVDSLHAAWEFDEPMCFSTAAGMLVEEYLRRHPGPAVLQAHEWMAGFSLLHCKSANVPVGKVFTTHATILGRSIAGNGHDLYAMLPTLDPSEWAYRLGVQDKHTAEVACAKHADVFTTVSEITGIEAERLLGKKPDVLLFNGFHTDRFPTFEETSIRHVKSRNSLRELMAQQFLPYYVFDPEKTLFFFTSGRYEFQNKGIDVLIDALGQLNDRLKSEKYPGTIVVFFWVIMGRRGVRQEVLENKQFYSHVKSHVEWHGRPLLNRITLDLVSGNVPGEKDVFTAKFLAEIQEGVRRFKRSGTPPIATHDLSSPDQDPILSGCNRAKLNNAHDDPVKILLFPGYLDGTDGVLDLQYYDATAGAHLGIFPSFYEPWGYTPMESAVLGVPAITTDLAGFGMFVDSHHKNRNDAGVFVLQRMGVPREQVVRNLSDRMHWFASLSHSDRVQQGFRAKEIATSCDWKIFLEHYKRAHALALERCIGT